MSFIEVLLFKRLQKILEIFFTKQIFTMIYFSHTHEKNIS